MMDLVAEQTKRTQRAQEGLRSGRLKIEQLAIDQWRVTNGDNAPYTVRVLGSPHDGQCECEDFIARGKTGLRCKHLEVVRLSLEMTQRDASPDPRRDEKEVNMNDVQLTMDEQLKVLNTWLVPEWAIKKDKKVAHGRPFVWHEYTRIMLDKVFGPDAWSFVGGPIQSLSLANGDQLVYVAGRMNIRFADDTAVVRSDVGVGLVQSKVDSPDLSNQKTDVFETGYKSATTDAIKGCAADLGRCFRPMQDGAMAAAVINGRFAAAFPFPNGNRTKDLQYQHLMALVPAWATKTDSAIAEGKPFVPHEYVVQALDTVFGPHQWSFEIGDVTVKELPNGEMLVYAPGTLTAIFADGTAAMRFDVGIAPIRRKKDAADLVATPTENYETAFKAAVTDALKGCAGDLGCCFRPMLSEEMEAAVLKGYFDNEFKRLPPVAPDAIARGKRALGRDGGDLVGAAGSQPTFPIVPVLAVTPRLFSDGTPLKMDDPIERAAYEKYLVEHSNTLPINVNALRVWACVYGDGKPVAEDERARAIFAEYINEHAGSIPASADSLRVWHASRQHGKKNLAERPLRSASGISESASSGNGNGRK